MYHRTTARTFHPDLWEKYGVEQALNAGLALSPCTRILLIQLTGTSLPLGRRHPDARNPGLILERSAVKLCRGQCLDLEQQAG